jgi:hypothetical protein
VGSPCAADARLTTGVACVGDGENLRAFWWVGPEGDERYVPLPRVPFRHRAPLRAHPQWVEWTWHLWSGPAVRRTGQEGWWAYPTGFAPDQEGLGTDEDDAIAWLLAHPPTLWVERCAEVATPRRVEGHTWHCLPGSRGYCWRCGGVEPLDGMRRHFVYRQHNGATRWVQTAPTCSGCAPHVWAADLPDAWCAPDGARPATADELAVPRG